MKNKVILVGAGNIQDTSFLTAQNDAYFVACDGGYRYFQQKGTEPDLLVGDFDTFDSGRIRSPKELIRLNPIKDDSDTFYAVKKLLEEGYRTFHLYGCYGGKSDHFIANIQILSYLAEHHATAYLHSEDDETILFCLTPGTYSFRPDAKGRFSVFSLTDQSEGVTLKGFQYTLENHCLNSLTPLGLSNEFYGGENEITLKTGRLLIVAPKSFLF